MKRAIALLMIASMVGCMSNRSQKKLDAKANGNLAAERKIAEKLPIVKPESVTSRNAMAKARELEEEMNRDEKRLAAANSADDLRR
jgi:hypothetical protein